MNSNCDPTSLQEVVLKKLNNYLNEQQLWSYLSSRGGAKKVE